MSIRSTLVEAFYSLGRNINKASGRSDDAEVLEGALGPTLPELSLDLDEGQLIDLADDWEKAWKESDVKTKWEQACKDNEDYWRGKHYQRPEIDKSRPMVDNAIFEGLETYLPQVTQKNPEPMVQLAASEMDVPEGGDPSVLDAKQKYTKAVQAELADLADELKLRLKLKGAARHKELYLAGAVKIGWDLARDIPTVKVTRPQRLILDPDASVDEDGYTGDRIGEHRRLPAWKIIKLIEGQDNFDRNKEYITKLAQMKMGTEIGFVEWWTPDYYFWKLDDLVLLKRKNPHWNYEREIPMPEPTEPQVTEEGDAAPKPEGEPESPEAPETGEQAPTPTGAPKIAGFNHFAARKVPYVLLVTYGLGKQPVDITSNIGQNLANQDIINKRNKQIDRNADSMNSGLVVSLERSGLTKDEAKGVTVALRKGGTVVIPTGAPEEAVWRMPTPGLPADVYNDLNDKRARIRDIWGVRGSSPAGIQNEDTVRGKVIVQNLDTSRIGGGISEYLEQFSDDIYNWLYQMLVVYDERFANAIHNGAPVPKVRIGVKEGSLLPKDSTTIANQAIELAGGGKMSLLDLYKRLDDPNPEEMAVNAWLEINAPDVLYASDPRVKQVVEQRQQAQAAAEAAKNGGAKPPSESIAFKDLPPEGKSQMAAQAGIQLAPEVLAAHEMAQNVPQGTPAVPVTSAPAGP